MEVKWNEADQFQNSSGIKEHHTYKSLGFWRKAYLFFNWFYTVTLFLIFGWIIATDRSVFFGIYLFIPLAFLSLGLAYWIHRATVHRKIRQLLVIVLLNIFPFPNPVAVILVFLIWLASHSELRAREGEVLPK